MIQERLNYLILLLSAVTREEFGYSITLLALALTLRHIDEAIMPLSGENSRTFSLAYLRDLKRRINAGCMQRVEILEDQDDNH